MPNLPNLSSLPKISLTRNQLILIAAGLAVIIIVIVLFFLGGSKGSNLAPVTIKIWGTEKDEVFQAIAAAYKVVHPNATVKYTLVSAETYDETVLNALASGNGPDVFVIGNHDLLKRGALLAPAPETQMSLADLQQAFPQAVAQDLVYGGQVFAVPLYMDTLALAYNKEMFDQAGIATPPRTWQDIIDIIPRLRLLDQNGQLARAALAVGGSEKSVDHATDILNLVMLQNGARMADDKGFPDFGQGPGAQAFRFYLQFADSSAPAYTWNDFQQKSIESFIAQKAAMAFVYKEDIKAIKARNPFLDFGVVAAPQVSAAQAVNYPSYRALAVWTGSKVKASAWDLAIFAATDLASQAGYLNTTGHPPALRTFIAQVDKDPDLGVFSRAALTARSWKMGDYDKIKEIFSTAVQNVQSGAKKPDAALKDAETQVQELVRR